MLWGLAHRELGGIQAIGVDEIHWGRGLKADNFLTVIYQIDRQCRRLLWVGRRRSRATLQRGLKALGPEVVKGLRFVCTASTGATTPGYPPDGFRFVFVHGHRSHNPARPTSDAPQCGGCSHGCGCLRAGGLGRRIESIYSLVLQSAGRATAPLVCRSGVAQAGPWRRSSAWPTSSTSILTPWRAEDSSC